MRRNVAVLAPICIMFLVVAVFSARAQWVEDGTVVAAYDYYQGEQHIIPDGTGGVFIAWTDHRNGAHDEVYAQRFDADGNALWTPGGVDVTQALAVDQEAPQIVPVGDGGVIIIYENNNMLDFNITAQRLDADGNILWPMAGHTICAATGDQEYPVAVSDGSGGAVVAWRDERDGNMDVYVQRIDSSGAVQWAANGVAICTAADTQSDIVLVSDGNHGAIMTWTDHRAGTESDIYTQRVNQYGATTWSANGVPVCTATDYQYTPQIIPDGGGGAIITWMDYRSGGATDIYAQRVDPGGWMQWAANGEAICTAMNAQDYPQLVPDGAGGAIIAWEDYRGTMIVHWNVYAQRVDLDGNVLWAPDGVAICTAWDTQSDVAITSTPDGGAIIAWEDSRNGVEEDVFAQKIDTTGNVLWETNGMPVSDVVDMQVHIRLVEDGEGGAVVSWMDNRPEDYNWDLYALRIDHQGNWGYPAPVITGVEDVPHDQGRLVTVTWDASRLDAHPHDDITHYAVWRSTSGPPGYVWSLRGQVDVYYQSAYTYSDSTTADSTISGTAYHHYKVIAHTSDPLVYWESNPDSGYSVDNTSPAPPTGLAAEQRFEPEGLALSWDANTEPDLFHYTVYRGSSEDFAPSPETRIASPTAAAYFDEEWQWDSGYIYKVAAVDAHGNESPCSLIGPDGITGGPNPEVPAATFLAQNYPNPFNPATTIRFGLREAGHVNISIYDAAGRLVRVLLDESREAERYELTWNGRDNAGNPVASGIYFYRLAAESYYATKKMLLLR
ncbi:MAG: T9SS type A sorting domain-containing protein [bacterium]|nr:MAG: T9SS type A sorting domain-containing protein [bacterium]